MPPCASEGGSVERDITPETRVSLAIVGYIAGIYSSTIDLTRGCC